MKVLKSFTCKVTRKRYEEGDEYNGLRGEELIAKGLVAAPEKVEIKKTKEKVETQVVSKKKM